jgi:hypothetical protein
VQSCVNHSSNKEATHCNAHINEAIYFEAIDLEAINLEAIDFESIHLEAVNLETIDLKAHSTPFVQAHDCSSHSEPSII